MQNADLIQIVGAVSTGIGSMFALLKFALEKHFKQEKELEDLRNEHNKKAIQNLDEVVKSLVADAKVTRDDMSKFRLVAVQLGAKIETLSGKYEELNLEMRPLIEALKRKVRKQEHTGVKDLGQNFFRVEKKPGSKE